MICVFQSENFMKIISFSPITESTSTGFLKRREIKKIALSTEVEGICNCQEKERERKRERERERERERRPTKCENRMGWDYCLTK